MQFYFCIVEVQPNFTERSDVKLVKAEWRDFLSLPYVRPLSRGSKYPEAQPNIIRKLVSKQFPSLSVFDLER